MCARSICRGLSIAYLLFMLAGDNCSAECSRRGGGEIRDDGDDDDDDDGDVVDEEENDARALAASAG